ncbi:fungal-specific transcription factor domain-containing protein [Aspergillus avenaceus]|uniref:Fungal-specific transcription factor domain-containing protein n=1 Tax=Aspergillus avenaceus TaxID=36643 RepID=A0A5N6U2K7_ASPAV|nr:fungal-specific transcription factor domain-containing protein [Aspergillus avenaceus]
MSLQKQRKSRNGCTTCTRAAGKGQSATRVPQSRETDRSIRRTRDVDLEQRNSQRIHGINPPFQYPPATLIDETATVNNGDGTDLMLNDIALWLSGADKSFLNTYSSTTSDIPANSFNPYCSHLSAASPNTRADLELRQLLDLSLGEDMPSFGRDLSIAFHNHGAGPEEDNALLINQFPSSSDVSEACITHSEFDDLFQRCLEDDRPEIIKAIFAKYTCGVLSDRYINAENPWLAVVWPMASNCRALYHALSAMTYSHMSYTQPQLHSLGQEHYHRSVEILPDLENSNTSSETVIATRLALAFADSWNCQKPTTGINHLNSVKPLIEKACREGTMEESTSSQLICFKLLASTWMYRRVIACVCTDLVTLTDSESTNIYNWLITQIGGLQISPLMGCGISLLPLIGRLAEIVRRVRTRAANRNSPMIISRAIELRVALEKWEPWVDTENSDLEASDLIQTAEAYRWAALLFLRQAVPELPASCSMSKLAQKTLVFLATTPPASATIATQVFPLMIAGCEAFDEDDREWVLQRWETMSKRMKTVGIDRCRDVTLEVWRRRDEFETRHGLRDLIIAYQAGYVVSTLAMDATTPYDALRVPWCDAQSANNNNPRTSSASKRSNSVSSDFPESAAFKSGIDPMTRAGYINYTVRGELHWFKVMKDWDWEVILA